ncbi:hypothetical protein E2C01_095415 [Portunus trituberculatus]|uniref:Uncharacterized protein n=1 Tax=Portunus trituberculatus TaxID=210409 RepID=A0A5B7K460_PORTR|nr:hypothetical protein [Portunus trituberculatus]
MLTQENIVLSGSPAKLELFAKYRYRRHTLRNCEVCWAASSMQAASRTGLVVTPLAHQQFMGSN